MQGEVDIGDAHFHQALEVVARMAACGPRQGIAKQDEAFCRNLCQQGLLVFEMTIRSGDADPCEAGGVTESKAFDTVLLDQRKRGADQGCAQVSVVVAAVGSFSGQCYSPAPVYFNVNLSNMYVSLFYMDSGSTPRAGTFGKWTAAGLAAAPGLTVFGFIMAADLAFTLCGLAVDRRVITGAPAWLKPAKFALSTMIVGWSFAFCIAWTSVWRRFTRVLDGVLTAGLLIEIGLIDLQAARGTSSHFNVGTHFDATVFAVMGVSIGCIWLSMLLLAVVLFRQKFASSAWGWSLRLGMVLALVGTGSGGLMTVPNSTQLAEAHATGRLPIAGAHTVGAPDGGRGVPVTGWSADHGDLRVAHFVGIHGLQILPLLAWWIARRRRPLDERTQRHLVFAAATSYLALFGLLLWQAFRGQSIVQPDRWMVEGFAVWLAITASALIAITRRRSSAQSHLFNDKKGIA
jgi:hypothetical protein